jgi:hypothetical protein
MTGDLKLFCSTSTLFGKCGLRINSRLGRIGRSGEEFEVIDEVGRHGAKPQADVGIF